MKSKYHIKLPRPIKSGFCQIMNNNGDLCNKRADFEIYVFGDREGIHNGIPWLTAKVCKNCVKEYDIETKQDIDKSGN